MEPITRIELVTSPLPRECSTAELYGPCKRQARRPATPTGPSAAQLERVMGIEPTSSAWKAEVLPLNYTRRKSSCCGIAIPAAFRSHHPGGVSYVVEGGGFEPPKAEPSDLQSDPFDHSGTPPELSRLFCPSVTAMSTPHRGPSPNPGPYNSAPPPWPCREPCRHASSPLPPSCRASVPRPRC